MGVSTKISRIDRFPPCCAFIARRTIGTYGGADDATSVSHDLGGHVTDAVDVCIAILFAEAQAFGKMCPYYIAVQHGHLSSVFQ